ncbi:unnamed protein product, partial [Prunus brigantina]
KLEVALFNSNTPCVTPCKANTFVSDICSIVILYSLPSISFFHIYIFGFTRFCLIV